MRYKKKTEYELLRDKWYKKLKKSGFEDIEYPDGSIRVDHYKYSLSKKSDLQVWQAKAAYYQMAENFLNDYKFSTKIEKIIWEYHANGVSTRDIASILNKVRVKKTNRTTVWQAIKRMKSSMYNMYVANLEEYHE